MGLFLYACTIFPLIHESSKLSHEDTAAFSYVIYAGESFTDNFVRNQILLIRNSLIIKQIS